MKNRKTKLENLGMVGRLNPGFGFEKVWVSWVFRFGRTLIANLYMKAQNSKLLTRIRKISRNLYHFADPQSISNLTLNMYSTARIKSDASIVCVS